MATLNGKQPTYQEIDKAAKELENKVRALIEEFEEIYSRPAIVLIEGHSYRATTFIDGERLRRQYGNMEYGDFGYGLEHKFQPILEKPTYSVKTEPQDS